uniref:BTB domain-containing protein n=1 Tax=Rhipicephalus microplus TaxID=6941 RepID=A0A6M2D2N6_RHIMP
MSYCRRCSNSCVSNCARSTQTTMTALTQFSFMPYLESEVLTDVEFVVDSKHHPGKKASFKAHRLILALQNDAFKVMFYKDFAKQDRIAITDLHPDGFLGMLRYLYSGVLKVDNVRQAFYTRTAATKYLMPELKGLCSDYLAVQLKPDDVCAFLDNMLIMGEQDTDEPVRNLLHTNGADVLSSSGFKSCLESTVSYILEHIKSVPELTVIEAVYEWAQEQVLLEHPDEEGVPNIRKFMQPFFTKLRFLALTPSDFVRGINTWGILNEKEALALLSTIIDSESAAVPHGFCKMRKNRV